MEEALVQYARKIFNKIESGELDPERMGSGIQYGDAALRQLRSPRLAQAPSGQEYGCLKWRPQVFTQWYLELSCWSLKKALPPSVSISPRNRSSPRKETDLWCDASWTWPSGAPTKSDLVDTTVSWEHPGPRPPSPLGTSRQHGT